MMTPWIAPLIFLFVTACVAAIGTYATDRVLRLRWLAHRRLADEFPQTGPARNKPSPVFRDLKLLQAQTSRSRVKLWQQFASQIEQSGLPLSPGRIIAASLLLTIAMGLVFWLICPYAVVAAAGALIGGAAPFLIVSWVRRARIRALCEQLPEAFDQMRRALRSGQTLSGAILVVASDMRPPISEEFSICYQQQGLGLPFQVTLYDLARRTGVMELQIFAVALLVQREAGGNSLELLSNLSETVRKRLRLAGRVKALTSEGRMQAMVLALLPIVAFLAIQFLDPDYGRPLIERPNLLFGIIAAEVVGTLWIRKIVSVEY